MHLVRCSRRTTIVWRDVKRFRRRSQITIALLNCSEKALLVEDPCYDIVFDQAQKNEIMRHPDCSSYPLRCGQVELTPQHIWDVALRYYHEPLLLVLHSNYGALTAGKTSLTQIHPFTGNDSNVACAADKVHFSNITGRARKHVKEMSS